MQRIHVINTFFCSFHSLILIKAMHFLDTLSSQTYFLLSLKIASSRGPECEADFVEHSSSTTANTESCF